MIQAHKWNENKEKKMQLPIKQLAIYYLKWGTHINQNHIQCISHHITLVVINALGGRHTDIDTYAHVLMYKQKQFQETKHIALPWFKNFLMKEGVLKAANKST